MAQATALSATRPLPPGSLGLPWVGETLAFLGDAASFFESRSRRHGPVFKTRILGDNVVCFVGPDALSFFLDDRVFTRENSSPPHVQQLFHPKAVPFMDGPAFTRRKALLMQAFTPAALDQYAATIERVMNRYAARWAERRAFAWAPELGAMSLTIADALFTGADPDIDDPSLQTTFAALSRGVLSVPIDLPLTPYHQALKARDVLVARVDRAVAAHRQGPRPPSLLSRLIDARDPSGDALSDEELQIEMFHFFSAYSGVYAALAWQALFLARSPEVTERLRAEVASVAPAGPLSVAALKQLPFLDQVCKEVRRAQPIVALTFFATVKEDAEFGGCRIPKGWKAVGGLAATMQDERVFTHPERFDPDRFGAARAEDRRHDHAWVPHGGGDPTRTHRCAGEALATMMMKAFGVLMARGYAWTVPEQDLSPTRGGLFPVPTDGLKVEFTGR